ncbi:hypothetical protein L2E82_42303 [Cichorium intybus]|uniref:Uncharacterized protein n=1 Tax=Cichorium intybus TaxID=13427 RepID=A0ACB8ZR67_CICIN|nr:hypothetical protein L2E82_42303 [Cichorium intybus]
MLLLLLNVVGGLKFPGKSFVHSKCTFNANKRFMCDVGVYGSDDEENVASTNNIKIVHLKLLFILRLYQDLKLLISSNGWLRVTPISPVDAFARKSILLSKSLSIIKTMTWKIPENEGQSNRRWFWHQKLSLP